MKVKKIEKYFPISILVGYLALVNIRGTFNTFDIVTIVCLASIALIKLYIDYVTLPDYKAEVKAEISKMEADVIKFKKEYAAKFTTLEKDHNEVKTKFNATVSSRSLSGIANSARF